jgi:hypothetical protein
MKQIVKESREVMGMIKALEELQAPPRWETPEQREKRTGDPWPDNAPVWARLDTTLPCWVLFTFSQAMSGKIFHNGHTFSVVVVVCATEAGKPSDGWKPGEES